MEQHEGALEDAEQPLRSRRDRVRASTIDEIKGTAMRLMRDHGSEVRFADIAREMGMTAPALYRYFADREELISALMVDGFHAFASRIAEALDRAPGHDLAARIRAAAHAYRSFAVADPQRFSLLFGLPAPGYGSHSQSGAVHANLSAMANFEQIVRTVIGHGVLRSPIVRDVGRSLAEETAHKQAEDGARIPADTYQSLLHALAAIHGFACLEAFGHLNWFSEQARNELYEAQLTLLAQAMGAP